MADMTGALRVGISRDAVLVAHMRSNMVPPMPVEYAGWAADLLDRIAEDGGVEFCDFDQRVSVPDAVLECGVIPRRMDTDGTVRLGDMTQSLRIYDMAAYDNDGDDE